MDKGIVYICERPHVVGYIIKSTERGRKNQAKINKNIGIFALSMLVYAAISEMHNRELTCEVKRLSGELEELRREKGE